MAGQDRYRELERIIGHRHRGVATERDGTGVNGCPLYRARIDSIHEAVGVVVEAQYRLEVVPIARCDGRRIGEIDTAGYNYVKIFDTPGRQDPSRDDSRQYELLIVVAFEDIDPLASPRGTIRFVCASV